MEPALTSYFELAQDETSAAADSLAYTVGKTAPFTIDAFYLLGNVSCVNVQDKKLTRVVVSPTFS